MSAYQQNQLSLNLKTVNELIDSCSSTQKQYTPLQKIAQWSLDYLCNPDSEISKNKFVCPWTPAAMNQETFWLEEITTRGRSNSEIEKLIHSALTLFKSKSPQYGEKTQFKTILLVFSDIEPSNRVEFFQEKLKPYFLNEGLMLGEFYADCDTAGLRNPDSYPMRSPIPLLVVREMLAFDIAFMAKGKDSENYEKYVNKYFDIYGEEGIKKAKKFINNCGKGVLSKSEADKLQEIIDARQSVHHANEESRA